MTDSRADLEPFYQHAVEHAAVGIHAVDLDGRTILYNRKMKQIEGLELAELGDRSLLELFRFGRGESTLLRVLQSGEPVLNVKQTYWNPKGQEITTVNDTYPVRSDGFLVGAIELSRDVTKLERALYQPLKKQEKSTTFNSITAASPSMKRVVETAKKAADARLPVLLIGESGTGKELIAESIHSASSDTGQFYTLFCHSADRELIRRLDEQLHSLKCGTIFCERLDLLPADLQSMLLSVLQTHVSAELYFMASIGEDPIELIASSRLLKDLYYFFSSMAISIEPLRNRKEDILPFVLSYFKRHRLQYGSALTGLSEEVLDLFHRYDWPGNLKELEVLLDEISSVSPFEETVTIEMLPQHFLLKLERNGNRRPEDFLVLSRQHLMPLEAYLQEAEMYYVEKALSLHGGNVTKAAQALGMSRQNLQYRLRKLKKNGEET